MRLHAQQRRLADTRARTIAERKAWNNAYSNVAANGSKAAARRARLRLAWSREYGDRLRTEAHECVEKGMRAQAAGHCWHVRAIVAAIACVALALLARTCGLRSHALVSPHPRLLAIPNAPGFVFSVITGLADARAGDRPRTPPLAEGATDRAQQSEVRLGMARSPARLCQLLDVRQHACVSSRLHPRHASARVIPLRQVADANLVRPCPCSASLVRTRAYPFELLPAVAAPAAAHAAAALARAPAPRAPGKRARPPRALLALSRPQPPRALEDTPELGTCSPSPRRAGAAPRAPLARTRQYCV